MQSSVHIGLKHLASLLVVLVFIASAPALAGATEHRVQMRGYGMTHPDAVVNGLQEASRQVTGVSIDSREIVSRQSTMVSVDNGGESDSTALFDRSSQSAIAIGTSGVIKEYRVLFSDQENGQHVVELLVTIEKYESPGLSTDSRRKLAVMPFRPGRGVSARSIDLLSQSLVNEFTQSRRFAILDREYEEVMTQERDVWASSDVSVLERAKLGQRLGADYLVYGTVSSLWVNTKKTFIEMTDETIVETSGGASVEYRIMVPATGQVKWSDTVSTSIHVDGGAGGLEAQMLKRLAKKIVHESMEVIYPIRIINIAGSKIYINQGGKTVSSGDRFDVFSLGEELIDPYTNESLGQEEVKIGAIVVKDVKPKYAIAEVVAGDRGAFEKNYICRRGKALQKSSTQKPKGSKSSVKANKSGGVVLPFDK
ncbi:hypothetical protein DPQ33_17430 [Oceanidesulfovibrio indonesiensis]|uniref:Curli production assembly/transport component CsgG n=1 Tax=Oceanidesulfovibrio indonesiensis TaxID=54767 RepID=A0A7M3MA74_9BACT|nr:CsgG/HfaB family protein [Oceanidesulfovibrio indonesiensis]TVM14497.1 hypothetical protein DPQ33_17430 [Oceanidesulfovibrio indonesiensis]